MIKKSIRARFKKKSTRVKSFFDRTGSIEVRSKENAFVPMLMIGYIFDHHHIFGL